MRKLKTLHLASFVGNTGDGAMHDGAYRTRAADCPFGFEYTPVEIRDFVHWGTRRFDSGFIDHANSFDCVVFGGNSIFQMWRDNTASGTYFDFAPDYLTAIDRPVVFYGIGCDATRGIDASAMRRFTQFLDACLDRGNVLFSLRNDGSRALIEEGVGAGYAERMTVIPDGGLYAEPDDAPHRDAPYIIVNLAGDMPDIRYGRAVAAAEERFAGEIARQVDGLLAGNEDLRVVYVPHIYTDLSMIARALAAADDRNRRTRIEVGPYLVDPASWSGVFALYRGASAVLAMRFHANLVPIGLGVPTTGLASHHKVSGLYDGLGLKERCHVLDPDDPHDAVAAAFAQVALDLRGPDAVAARRRQAAARDTQRDTLRGFHGTMANWLDSRL